MQSEWKQDNLDVLTKLSSLKRARNYKIKKENWIQNLFTVYSKHKQLSVVMLSRP